MSLYKQYIEERTNKSVIETEIGFVTYSYPNPTSVYIEDIYIVPDDRRLYNASDLANLVIAEAKSKGCTRALGSVVPSARNSTESLKAVLGYGFRLDSSTQDFILLSKDI
jgi:hypothetical protein